MKPGGAAYNKEFSFTALIMGGNFGRMLNHAERMVQVMINKTRPCMVPEELGDFLLNGFKDSCIIHLIKLNPDRAGMNKTITAQFTEPDGLTFV